MPESGASGCRHHVSVRVGGGIVPPLELGPPSHPARIHLVRRVVPDVAEAPHGPVVRTGRERRGVRSCGDRLGSQGSRSVDSPRIRHLGDASRVLVRRRRHHEVESVVHLECLGRRVEECVRSGSLAGSIVDELKAGSVAVRALGRPSAVRRSDQVRRHCPARRELHGQVTRALSPLGRGAADHDRHGTSMGIPRERCDVDDGEGVARVECCRLW